MELRKRHWDRHGTGGLTFTELGFGAAPLGNLYRAISDEAAQAILNLSWNEGIRYYDTAPLYGFGLSETRLNTLLRSKSRDDFVLSTKVGRLLEVTHPEKRDGFGKWFEVPARREIYDYTYDGVMRSIEFSLERLGVDRIDILYGHDLDVFNHGSQAVLDAKLHEFLEGGHKALVELREQGTISAFGLGVNEWQPAQWIVEHGDPDIILLAGRYTLLEQEALKSFLPMCERRGVGIVIGGPYNSGILATGPRPGAFYNYDPAPQEVLDRVARIEAICSTHNVRMIDAAFQFPLCHPAVLSVIPGGQTVGEMESNLQAAKADIPSDLWRELKSQGLIAEEAPILG
ncbi:aldo/keto reductase [Ruegeria arenilitoris]|uniref:aldo/keto reductase n=1 Tax=Ruegeria arenilitoris TaxID=1173585 RepID=UPI00147F6022|nr:aldo/keto reductase [Ruegeria arenilitoris]